MPGIIQGAQQPQMAQPPMQPPTAPQSPGAQPGAPQVNPQMQVGIAKIANLFAKAIQQSGIYMQIPKLLGGKNPAMNLANATYNILHAVLEKAGGGIPTEVLPGAASECLSMMVELGEASKSHAVDEQLIIKAMGYMLKRFMSEAGVKHGELAAAAKTHPGIAAAVEPDGDEQGGPSDNDGDEGAQQ